MVGVHLWNLQRNFTLHYHSLDLVQNPFELAADALTSVPLHGRFTKHASTAVTSLLFYAFFSSNMLLAHEHHYFQNTISSNELSHSQSFATSLQAISSPACRILKRESSFILWPSVTNNANRSSLSFHGSRVELRACVQ